MTRFQELSLRPQGQAWPGLNTRSGFLSRGIGELEDGSTNAVIERGDVMMKRRGLVRGLDERFEGVVCGLFKYTDECGIEWLLVADQEGIKVRQPFHVPIGETSDAYPQDDFAGTGDPNELVWRNTARYTRNGGALVLQGSAAQSMAAQVPASFFMRWFKDASNPSYQISIQYTFDGTLAARQRVSLVIRGSTLLQGAFLQVDLERTPGSSYTAKLWHRRVDLTYRELLSVDIPSPAQDEGFLTIRYLKDVVTNQFIVGFNVTAEGGVIVDQDAPTLTEFEDADLGFVSAVAMDRASGVATDHQILSIDGGPL